jgi:chloramphenicol O-acetyltransferase
MRIRYVNGKVVIYDEVNPAYTVMTKSGTFENVCSKYHDDFDEFYKEVKKDVEEAKELKKVKDDYNESTLYNEYYITCLPWIDFSGLTHPIPDDKESQVVPRICFGKYHLVGDKYKMMLNITVSHEFVDGYPLSQVFINIQNMLYDLENIFK